MLNVGCQPNDIVISHWQDASSTGTLRSACATDSPSMQNHLPDYSELHILPTAMRSLILTQQPIYQTPLTDTCSSRKAGLGVRTIARAVRSTKHTTKPITDKTSLLDKNWWHPLTDTCSSRKAGLGVRIIARTVRTTKHTLKPITDKTSLLDKNWWHPLSVTLPPP